jgi:hypothetical protein
VELRRVGVSVFGAVVIISVVLVAASIWLVLTDPVTVATAVNEGEVSAFVRDLAQVIVRALQGLLKYL